MNKIFALIITVSVIFSSLASASDYVLTVKDYKFTPTELIIPENQKVKITIINQDSSPIEFESDDLKREKIIRGNSKGIVFVGPLAKGSYAFMDEFHPETAQGIIKVE